MTKGVHGAYKDSMFPEIFPRIIKGTFFMDGVAIGLVDQIFPILKKCEIKLYFSGHDHITEVRKVNTSDGFDFIQMIYGAATKIDKLKPVKLKHKLVDGTVEIVSEPYLGFGILEVSQDELILNTYVTYDRINPKNKVKRPVEKFQMITKRHRFNRNLQVTQMGE